MSVVIISYASLICVSIALIILYLKLHPLNSAPLRKIRHRASVYAVACLLWPGTVITVIGLDSCANPVITIIAIIVLLFLTLEITPLCAYRGSIKEYENIDNIHERVVQVSTVAFAVATLLLSQKEKGLAKSVNFPIFCALLFCTLSAIPSAMARRRPVKFALWNSVQKVTVSYAAGFLCLAVAKCLVLSAHQR